MTTTTVTPTKAERMIEAMKTAFCIAVILAAALSAARANNENEDSGGFVIPGSTDGVNPAYHPEYFGSPPNYACFERFKTYDVSSETYVGADGRRHSCRWR